MFHMEEIPFQGKQAQRNFPLLKHFSKKKKQTPNLQIND